MNYITIEKVSPKIILIKFSSYEPNDKEFEEYLKQLHTIYNQDARFVIVLDASDSKYLPAKQRIMQGNWLKENLALIQKKCIAQVFIINNVMVKMLMQGILLIQKLPVPYFVLSSRKEAIDKANELIAKDK